jgi:GNAT superfamily N-acetyltransferase
LLLLDHLGYHPNIMNDKKVNQLLDIFAVVVKPNYRRMGIATQLITKAITEAQLVDIPLVTVVCTSAFTQRCCAKLGFNAENTIFYKDWHYKNLKFLTTIKLTLFTQLLFRIINIFNNHKNCCRHNIYNSFRIIF